MEKITLKINGREVEASQEMTVLQAALKAGIYIPTLCYYPDLEPYGGCRLCIVEIENMRGTPTACTTLAVNGMVVTTNSPVLQEGRRDLIDLLLRRHPCDCLICEKRDQCELQKVVDYLGIRELRLPQDFTPQPIDKSNPFFDLDRNRCILCSRCVRACQEITGVGAIDMSYRGHSMKVATFGDTTLMESICRSCGECMVRCPVGALIPKEFTRPERETKTVCPYCGVGCSMYLGVKDGKLTGVRGDPEGPANQGRLCVKGRFGIAEFVNHQDRLTTPLVRKDGQLVQASWDEALNLVAQRLQNYNGYEVAVISSAKSTNEDNYVMQKFGRAVLGTNNIDHCARL
jgi:predicted molibdopterin-dependent oxidoreductase YjgC